MFWLCGKAGTAKSTIARMVERYIEDNRHLGASVLLEKGEADRRNAKGLISTIVNQRIIQNPQLAPFGSTWENSKNPSCGGNRDNFRARLSVNVSSRKKSMAWYAYMGLYYQGGLKIYEQSWLIQKK